MLSAGGARAKRIIGSNVKRRLGMAKHRKMTAASRKYHQRAGVAAAKWRLSDMAVGVIRHRRVYHQENGVMNSGGDARRRGRRNVSINAIEK